MKIPRTLGRGIKSNGLSSYD